MYLTYSEYQSMGGTMDFSSYDNFEFEAEAVVNWYTFNRLANDTVIPEAVKRLMKYLIDSAWEKSKLLTTSSEGGTSGLAVTSQSNDGVSTSYNVLSAAEIMSQFKTDEGDTVRRYLQGVVNEAGRKLLYRGLYPNE